MSSTTLYNPYAYSVDEPAFAYRFRRETGGRSQGSFEYHAHLVPRSYVRQYELYTGIFDEAPIEPSVEVEPTVDLSWLMNAIAAGRDTCEMDTLATLIAGLGDLLSDENYEAIDLILRSVALSSVSPEVMLAFARTSFAARHRLTEWKSFVQAVRQELALRGVDADRAVRGLI